ncbi:phosphoribosylamine--glycine ligase [Candidatus Uhrbacteria bacterium]|nr:phosphoribosylamine--glycine ligase [Candidatus Uhrbacteria bacterium]
MEPKKFLFISLEGLIGDIAWQLTKEGHQVKYCIEHGSEKDVADGFVPKCDDWKAEVDWADVIVLDDVLGQGVKAQKLRQIGKAVIGGTPYTDRLEDDRAFGQEELKSNGVSIIPYKDFTSFDDAIAYVRENPNRYVIKPSGQAQTNKSLLFVGSEDDGRDVIAVLEDYQKAWSKKIPQFQLQRTIQGVELAVGGFFNGKEFAMPININFEHKKLFPGNIGPSTGEMGTSLFWSGPNRIFNQTLKRMEGKLAQEGFVGYIDINCIANNYGIYPLEWTARFGWPTIFIQQEGIITPMGELFFDLANGTLQKFKVKSGFTIGVQIVVPPFPFKDKETFEVQSKDNVVFFDKNTKNPTEGIHIEDVKLVNGEWVVTGTSGVVMVVCGQGQTMRQAQTQAYNRIKHINIPHMYYRTDIGDRWYEDSDRLHTWGYLREI